MAFIVDSSGSIGRQNWLEMKQFLKNMVKAFRVGPDKTHIALVVYSSAASVECKLKSLRGSQITLVGYYRLIDRLRVHRGFTFIDKGLIVADQEVFTEEAGMRPDIPKVRKEKPVSSISHRSLVSE